MNEYRSIREKIAAIASSQQAGDLVFTARVIGVSDTDCSIEVGGITLSQVKLYSIAAAGTYLVKPKTGSTVTVLDVSRGSKRDLCVVKVDEPECIRISSNGFVVDFDCEAGKFEIKNNGASLKELFETLINIIKLLKVTVPGIGLSAVPFADTQTSLSQLGVKINQLLK